MRERECIRIYVQWCRRFIATHRYNDSYRLFSALSPCFTHQATLYIHNDLSTVCWLRAHHLNGYMKCSRSLTHSLVLVQMRRFHMYCTYIYSHNTQRTGPPHTMTYKHIDESSGGLALSLSVLYFALQITPSLCSISVSLCATDTPDTCVNLAKAVCVV